MIVYHFMLFTACHHFGCFILLAIHYMKHHFNTVHAMIYFPCNSQLEIEDCWQLKAHYHFAWTYAVSSKHNTFTWEMQIVACIACTVYINNPKSFQLHRSTKFTTFVYRCLKVNDDNILWQGIQTMMSLRFCLSVLLMTLAFSRLI